MKTFRVILPNGISFIVLAAYVSRVDGEFLFYSSIDRDFGSNFAIAPSGSAVIENERDHEFCLAKK